MTEPIYLRDAYLRELATVVVAGGDGRVALRETIFYPGGGGQPPDQGWLRWDGGEAHVLSHHRDGEQIWHQVEGAAPGTEAAVQAMLDWPHRYNVMRYHTAMHVLSGVVYHLFRATVTGGQIYPDRARMDFALEDLTRERVGEIEREANRIIADDRIVSARQVTRAEFERDDLVRTARDLVPAHLETIRVVEIEGFDAQADGGTHVRRTGELGRLEVVRTENKGRINRRLQIALHL